MGYSQEYPAVKCGQVSYVSTESLRNVRSVWWNNELKLPAMIISRQHIYEEIEQVMQELHFP